MTKSNNPSLNHEFISYHSAIDEGEFAITVGFSRDPVDEESLDGLLLQRAIEPEEDAPGIEGVYIEIPIQRYVAYGGIVEAQLRRDSFILRFNEATAHKMGGFQQIIARFDLTESEFIAIRDGLRFGLAGCSCYTEGDERLANP